MSETSIYYNKKINSNELTSLPNIGKIVAERLKEVGIETDCLRYYAEISILATRNLKPLTDIHF